ncbi:hypothetical protein Maes01_02749 [Microbulbifer aestuariivivens]|uniref:DUF1631 domain-containing protein n=1 Tax=Microbulbifer aestuariivivens TaxID=1908308 RepID=A0ABP9WSQ1_9GAMM
MEIKEEIKEASLSEDDASARQGVRQDLDESSLKLPPIVLSLRDMGRELLLNRLKQLFSKVDDSLFSMAERAHGQEEQDGLFQALRVLRVERRNIATRFGENLDDNFRLPEELEAEDEPLFSNDLSLIHNDDLEQLVAVETMAANAEKAFADPLEELLLRLDELYPVRVDEKNNPLRPEALCEAFLYALRPLDIHIRARLTVLKKFEQVMMVPLGEFYDECNQTLVEQGILPDLKQRQREARQAKARARRAQPQWTLPAASPDTADSSEPGSEGTANHDGIAAILAAQSAQFAGGGLLPPSAGLPPMPATDLLGHLGELQFSAVAGEPDGPQLLDVSQLLQQRLVESQQSASLAKVDSDVIKLVEMLFSFIFDDRNLAAPIKSQLGRLQLPLLKVGIADKSLFAKSEHPARKLLNTLAEVSTGWLPGEDYEQEPLYREVARVVDRISKEFDRDIGLFSILLQSFEQFSTRERRRAEMLERRVIDEADGRARARAARARVAALIKALIAERDLPVVVLDWLNKVCSDVLFLVAVKEGTESETWTREVRTARDLVWSVLAPMPANRKLLLALLPTLQERLKAAAKSASLNPFEARRLFADLKEVYRERFALTEVATATVAATASAAEDGTEAGTDADTGVDMGDRAGEGTGEGAGMGAGEGAQAPMVKAVTEAPGSAGEAGGAASRGAPETAAGKVTIPQVEELEQAAARAAMTAGESGQGEIPALDESDTHWQMTFRLAQGGWFELKRPEGEQFRCRLAAVIKDIDQFIFVNRKGAKVAEFSRLELAHALRDARLVPMDDGMLFERALQSVISNVRKTREG